ncbi:MAG: tetratricopeptide repeat protein [Gemmatimonadetes bacterium]|nr:tetratricopeptide repeat protein [Gemmatimonadota bacterium]
MTRLLARAVTVAWLPSALLAQGAGRAATPMVPAAKIAAAANTPAGAYARGAYDDAVKFADAALAADSNATDAANVLVRALADQGRFDDALARGARFRAQPAVALAIAGVLEGLGQLGEADAALATAERGPDSLRATVERARLQRERGATDSATLRLRRVASASIASARTATDLGAIAAANRMLGRDDPSRLRDALRLYDQAIARDPARHDLRAELATMLLEKFNFPDARSALDAALAINPREPRVLLATVRLDNAEGQRPRGDPLGRLLALDPAHPAGRALAARRLLDAERYADAEAEARRGLVRDSTAPAPWVAIAASRYLAGDSANYRAALERAHRRLARSAQAEVEIAELAARVRLYRNAVLSGRAGLARDPRDARALAIVGVNELRLGHVDSSRAALTRAFALDPFDPWVKNTLDLLDTFAGYATVRTPHFALVMEQGDAEVLALYAEPLAEEAYATLSARYGWTPPAPVRMEFFRSHADFSVRAVGLAGLGALGVAFGNVVALDAPPARARGEFNWEAVLWHEFAHVITLGMTDNRVPRWVSEGLSVYEERRARPAWGGGITPTLVAAYKVGRLRPPSVLNDGFVHPRYDEEVVLSYALSAFVFEMLEERKGIAGLRALLAGYRDGGSTPQLMLRTFALAPAELDSTFDRWFRAKFAREFQAVELRTTVNGRGDTAVEASGSLRSALAEAARAQRDQQWDAAIAAANRAIALFPAFAEQGSGYHYLVAAYTARKDNAAARQALGKIATLNEAAVDENVVLGGLLAQAGDTLGALGAWSRAAALQPFDAPLQAQLADLARAARNRPAEIRARRAVVALNPADRAGAHYQLARAYASAGDTTLARREVLRALDLAPSFEQAQELLLSLQPTRKAP